MGESRALLVADDRCYTHSVEQAIEVHDTSPVDPIRAGLESAVAMAEADPRNARAALWKLQGDWDTLERLQEILGGEPNRGAMRIGAVIHLVRAELAQPEPRLQELIPEMLAWIDREG